MHGSEADGPVEVAALADERGDDVRVGDVGELWLKGPHVCRGYWNNPEATAQALDADGWFHTGDLARQDADGFYYIAGRKKDMTISGGVNIYPAEIEAALAAHPGVADSAVVGIPDDTWGEVSVAFVVRAPGSLVDADELSSYLLGVSPGSRLRNRSSSSRGFRGRRTARS